MLKVNFKGKSYLYYYVGSCFVNNLFLQYVFYGSGRICLYFNYRLPKRSRTLNKFPRVITYKLLALIVTHIKYISDQ